MSGPLEQAAPPLILIVEDELLVAMEMEDHVRALGYAVLGPTASVAGAECLLDGLDPQAALLDVTLRGETSAPIAGRLLRDGVPFALVTGYARLPLDEPALADAPRLSKPVLEAELASVLLGLLHRGNPC